MKKYFSVYNDKDKLLIDDKYINFGLSRKIKASTLPIVTVDESSYVTKGSNQFREISLTGDEIFAAVGGYTNRRCPYFIFNCLKKSGSELQPKHFICAADVVNGYFDRIYPDIYLHYDRDNEYLATQSYYVPDDLYVYVFSKSPTPTSEKIGFQIFNENGETVFDSRNKHLKVVDASYDVYADHRLPIDKALAIADTDLYMLYTNFVSGLPQRCHIGGHVLFESGWQSQRSGPTPYETPHAGIGMRVLYTNSTSSGEDVKVGEYNAPNYMVIDVTGF